MVKKWTIAGFIYLALVIAAYGIYDITVEATPEENQHEEMK